MSTQIGTASDYVDLLVKLDAFLTSTGHAWGKRFTGTGDGDLIEYLGTAASVAETITLTATSATSFTAVGTVSGALGTATVGTTFTSAVVTFKITAGTTPYVSGDVWTINVAPAWRREHAQGWADPRFVTTDLLDQNNLLDGSNSSLATRAATSCYMQWEMVTPSRVQRIYAQAPSSTTTRMPTNWTLSWRDNPGDAWTQAGTWAKASWANSEGYEFTTTADAGTHKYWRLDMSGATTSTAIAELALFPYTAAGPLGENSLTRAVYAWTAPGLDGTKDIVCMANTEWSQSSDIWNLVLSMCRTWTSPVNGIGVQPGFITGSTKRLLLGTTPISYWFIVNGQRAIIVTAFQGLMQIGYFGFGLPYEPPSLHAYPAIVGGTAGSAIRFSETNSHPRYMIDPGSASMTVPTTGLSAYFPDGVWRAFANKYPGSTQSADGNDLPPNQSIPGKVWPARYDGSATTFDMIVSNIDGTRTLLPCVLLCYSDTSVPEHTWGEFDGVYWTTGFGASPQGVVRYEGFDHLLVNNVFRTGANHFGAVRLD